MKKPRLGELTGAFGLSVVALREESLGSLTGRGQGNLSEHGVIIHLPYFTYILKAGANREACFRPFFVLFVHFLRGQKLVRRVIPKTY